MADLAVDPLRARGTRLRRRDRRRAETGRGGMGRPRSELQPGRRIHAPTVLGMPMHILNPAVGFYLMHAWIWKPNPAGMFADFNPDVTCP